MAKKTKEQVYQKKIAPLVDEIIKVCNESKIAFITDFCLGPSNEEGEWLAITSYNLEDETEPSRRQRLAAMILEPSEHE